MSRKGTGRDIDQVKSELSNWRGCHLPNPAVFPTPRAWAASANPSMRCNLRKRSRISVPSSSYCHLRRPSTVYNVANAVLSVLETRRLSFAFVHRRSGRCVTGAVSSTLYAMGCGTAGLWYCEDKVGYGQRRFIVRNSLTVHAAESTFGRLAMPSAAAALQRRSMNGAGTLDACCR